MNIVVYSALFGTIDKLWSVPPVFKSADARYVLFTERKRQEYGLWTAGYTGVGQPTNSIVSMMPGSGSVISPVSSWEQVVVSKKYGERGTARYYKTMAHELFPEAEVSIWIDANMRLLLRPETAIKLWLKKSDLVAFKHPDRNCLYEEAEFCIFVNKGNEQKIRRQVRAYKGCGMPEHWGLASTRCIIRRHTEEQAKLNEAWWRQIRTYSVRDQISLPFVCWRGSKTWGTIPGKALQHNHFWFIRHRHEP